MSQETQVMKKIFLEKIVLNMGLGKSGDVIETGKKCLEQITGKKPNAREAKGTLRDWGVRKGEPIGVAVTIRGQDAAILLKRLVEAKGDTLNGKVFDNFGNFSFGIKEHIDIAGVKYDPQIGILGLEVAVTLARPGYSIRKRSKHKARVGKHHIVTKDDAKNYMKTEFGVSIV